MRAERRTNSRTNRSVDRTGQPVNPLLSDMALYLKFEEESGNPIDYSGNDRTFTASNITYGQTGKLGKCFSFNGTSGYLERAYDAGLNPNGSFSFSFWAYVTGGAGTFRSPITSRTGSKQGYVMYADSTNKWAYSIYNGSNSVSPTVTDAAFNVVENTWQHVVGVYDGVAHTVKSYVNNVGTNAASVTITPNPSAVQRIGAGMTEASPDYFFRGLIDDFRFYNRALTTDEVAMLYNNGEGIF